MTIRIDQWLWAARFYKTRSLCKTAIETGKVHTQNQRVKPSRLVQVGEFYTIRQGLDEKTIEVLALSKERGPASVASTLYRETPESIDLREKRALERKLQPSIMTSGRPDKKQRRQIIRFKQS